MESGTTTRLMAAEFINGRTAEAIMASGARTICRAMATMSTLMEFNTMGNILTTRKKATVSTTGQMAVSTKDGGTKENSMDLASTLILNVAPGSTACGSSASALNGSTTRRLM